MLASYHCNKLEKPLDMLNLFWWFFNIAYSPKRMCFSDNPFSHMHEIELDLFDGILMNRSKILLGVVNYCTDEGYACLN
jgi:hypothetical protein